MSITVASILITSTICFGIAYIMMWHYRRRRLYELASKFEGPSLLPFIGNAHQLVGNGEHIMNKFDEFVKLYPPSFRLWLGPLFAVHVTDPEHIKVICLSPKTLGRGRVLMNYARDLLGEGLLTAPVSKWKVHRKLIQPTFNTKILDSFVDIFATQSKLMTEIMEQNLDESEFEIYDLIASYTLNMICETAIGVEGGAQTNERLSYGAATEKLRVGFFRRLFRLWLHPDFIYYRTKLGKYQQEQIKIMHDFTNDVIRMKRNELDRSGSAANEDETWKSTPQKKAFMDYLMMLPNGVSLSDTELRDEAHTMVLTGSETSAIIITYVMLMLASHPDVQEKAYQELYEIYENDDIEERPVTPKDLPRMKYLECVIKETMRLFPLVPFNVREVTDELDIGDQTLPSGTVTLIGIIGVHRNGKYWPDPLKFDPDRFLPEEVANRHPYTYLAFGGGPRNCIGQNYAMMSMKTMFATVLRKFILKKDEILPVKDIRVKMEILLQPVDPIKIRIERRTGN